MKPDFSTSRPLAVVATTPDDSHGWNLVAVSLELEARGFKCLNLGPCTPADLLAETIRDKKPMLVVISSVNGHGSKSIPWVLDTLEQYQMKRTAPIVAGGFLTTDPKDLVTARIDLQDAGISEVFSGPDAWADLDLFLEKNGLVKLDAA